MADSPRDRLRAARANGSPASRRPGEGNAGGGTAAVERKVRITVDLPESLHKALRVRVARDGLDAQSFIRRYLEEILTAELVEIRKDTNLN
jgi:hypothetical protein